MTFNPTPPAPMTATRAPAGTWPALVTAPMPVRTAQPKVASASNGTSFGAPTTASAGTTTELEKHAVPRKGATSRPRACSRAAPDGSLLRYVTFSTRSHNTARPSRHGGQTPHGGAQHSTAWSPAATDDTPAP